MVANLMALDTHQLVIHDYKSEKFMVVLYLGEESSKKRNGHLMLRWFHFYSSSYAIIFYC